MSIAMRPRFSLRVPMPPDEARARILAELETPGCGCRGEIHGQQLELRIVRPDHHTWSPQLVLWFEEPEPGQTWMQGKFGPDGHVWTMFMAGYAASVMIALGGAFVLSSQMMLRGQSRWGGWLIVAGGVGCVLVYVLARIGQRLAQPQTERIHALMCRAFPEECHWSS